MRKQLVPFCLALFVLLVVGSRVASAQTDTNTVTYTISSVTLVEIAGDVSLTIDAVNSVGGGLANDTDSTTYAITNNAATTKKLVGKLSAAMPSNTTLTLLAGAPNVGTSAGTVTLTASDQSLVTGIGAVDQTSVSMLFTMTATVNAALVNAGTKTLTLTLMDES